MASTKVTFHQYQARIGESIVIPHIDKGSVQIFESDLLSAGSGTPEWSVCFAVVEPMTAEEEREYVKQQNAAAKEQQLFKELVDQVGIEQAAVVRDISLPAARLRYEQAKAA